MIKTSQPLQCYYNITDGLKRGLRYLDFVSSIIALRVIRRTRWNFLWFSILALYKAIVSINRVNKMSQPDNMKSAKVNIMDVMKAYMPLIDRTLEKWIPRKWTEHELLQISGMKRYKIDIENLNKTTVDPIWELLDRGTISSLDSLCVDTHIHKEENDGAQCFCCFLLKLLEKGASML